MLLPYGLPSAAITRWIWQIQYGTPAYWIFLGLLVVVLLFALHRVYREWQEIHDVEEPDSPEDLLRSFREAHALGELNDDEMNRVERRLSQSPIPTERSMKPNERMHPESLGEGPGVARTSDDSV
jgi:uncharacterized membrane protein